MLAVHGVQVLATRDLTNMNTLYPLKVGNWKSRERETETGTGTGSGNGKGPPMVRKTA